MLIKANEHKQIIFENLFKKMSIRKKSIYQDLSSPISNHRASFLNLSPKRTDDFLFVPEDNDFSDITRKRAASIPKSRRVNLDDLSEEQLLDLAIETLQKAPEIRNTFDIKMLEKTTKNVDFFQNYDKETHEQICKYMTYLFCQKGGVLFHLGSIGNTFYIILKGSVEVWVNIPKIVEETKPDGTIETRTELVLSNVRVLQAGNSFGELSLMENKPRAATIICGENCHFGVLDKPSFDNILSNLRFE